MIEVLKLFLKLMVMVKLIAMVRVRVKEVPLVLIIHMLTVKSAT